MKKAYHNIRVDIEDSVAVFTMNNPPVNQLSERFVLQLAEAFQEACREDAVKAIVLTGVGSNFLAGADITQIKDIKTKAELMPKLRENHRLLNAIETGSKPVVAAINGNCLGGGLEIAMCCHYRVASRGVDLGQPEVQIGLIPGAGGTQRLPRLIGLPNALEMITTGKPIQSEQALQRGVVDEVVAPDKLIGAAVAAPTSSMPAASPFITAS